MLKTIGIITVVSCSMYGLYNLGLSYDDALNSKGPEYSNALRRLKIVDCKSEYKQTEVWDEQPEKLSNTQVDELITKIALRSCTLDQNHQLQDAAIEGFKLVHLKGASGVIVTAIDALKEAKDNKCEKSFDLVTLICPNSLLNTGYKGSN